jgi:hypothetical protein
VVIVELNGGTPAAKSLLAATPANQIPEIATEKSSLNAFLEQLPKADDKFLSIEGQAKKALSDVGELTSKLKESPSLLLSKPKEAPNPAKR